MDLKLIFSLCIMASLFISCGNKKAEIAKEVAIQMDSLKKAETTNNRILGVARIEPENGIVSILSGTSGRIIEVLIKENDVVKKGQAIVSIEISAEVAQLSQAKSKIGAQKALVQVNQANLEAIEVSFQHAKEKYELDEKLYAIKGQTKQILQDSKAKMDKLEKDLDAAKATIKQSNSAIGELNADIRFTEIVLKQKKVTAPFAGKILFLPVKIGEYVSFETQIAEFAPTGPYIAKTEVDELFADRVQLGQKAFILSQSTGDTLATGLVSFAAEYLKVKSLFKDQNTEQEDRRVREVHVRLDEVSNRKKPLIGSRVDCLINLK